MVFAVIKMTSDRLFTHIFACVTKHYNVVLAKEGWNCFDFVKVTVDLAECIENLVYAYYQLYA